MKMKKTWVDPRIEVQQFVPNEYVAACYTLVCAIPGKSYMAADGATPYRWFGSQGTKENPLTTGGNVNWGNLGTISADGMLHGNCGLETTSYDATNKVGYEHNLDGSLKTETNIYDITLGTDLGDRFYATWHSNNGTDYTHYGYAIKSSNENHS